MHLPKTNIQYRALVYLILFCLTTISCRVGAEDQETPQNKAEIAAQDKAANEHRALLYWVLVGEMAGLRNIPTVALPSYLKAATLSEDPAIAERATHWAVAFESPQPAMMAGTLWAKTAPNDLQANLVAMTLIIGNSVEKAMPYLKRAIEIDPKEIDQHLASIQSRLSERSAEHLKTALYTLADQEPKNAYVQLVAAQSAALQGEMPKANSWIDAALAVKPNLTSAVMLKARLIRADSKTDTQALQFLNEKLKKFPENAELRFFYATALNDGNQTKVAIPQLKQIIGDKTYGGKALILLSEIYLKESHLSEATKQLTKALVYENTRNNAQLLLGEIAQKQNKNAEAMKWYTQIEPGPYHVLGMLRAADLLRKAKEYPEAIRLLHDASPETYEEQKQLLVYELEVLVASKNMEEAVELSNKLLDKVPQDPDILFAHSFVALKTKNFKTAETDLRAILDTNPQNGEALNAMGYLLSLQPERLNEAKQYVSQALSITPNNPLYLDTMGWIYYKMGNNQEALNTLQLAFQLQADPDIAAHLGEVLWALNKKDEATTLWMAALKKSPDNETLTETIQRLKPSIATSQAKP